MKFHPHDSLLLEAFGSLSREQRRPVLGHLEQCASCRERLKTLHCQRASALFKKVAGLAKPPTPPGDYDSALDQAVRRFRYRQTVLERERSEAPGLLARLLEDSRERQEWLVQRNARFQTWGLLEHTLDQGRRATQKEPASGEPLIRLALTLADHLDEAYYGRERINDLRARIWSVLGNAFRLKSEFLAAETAFESSEYHLRQGTGDPLERAGISVLKSSLWRAQGRLDDAMALLELPLATYRQFGEWHSAGRALVGIGNIHFHAGRPSESIPLLNQALDLVDGRREPFLLLCTLHNLTDDLTLAGRIMEAQVVFMRARPLYATSEERGMQNKGVWVEGKIALGLGQYTRAEALLLRARDGLVREGLIQASALVDSELQALRARRPKTPRRLSHRDLTLDSLT